MSLSDCITKAGKALSGKDRQAIENLIAEGLSETEAVDQYLATVDQELEAVAGQVQEAGGEVARDKPVQFNQSTEDSKSQVDKNLFVTHNLSAENILAAADLGGLAAPSIAVARSDLSEFDGFGEVSLLADPNLLTDPKARVFDADIYSPRQPRATYDIDGKAWDKLAESLGDVRKLGLTFPFPGDLSEPSGAENLQRSEAMQYLWLQEQGKAPTLKTKKVAPTIKQAAELGGLDVRDEKLQAIAKKHYQALLDRVAKKSPERAEQLEDAYFLENGKVRPNALFDFESLARTYRNEGTGDTARLRSDISKKMRVKKNVAEYDKWVADIFSGMVKGKTLFKGFTPSGNRKYTAYNMQNVLREMTQALQAGESSFYGAPSVRSAYANEMKTLAQIKDKRDSIVTQAEMTEIKEESSSVFQDALDKLKPFYKFDADGWGYMNDAGEAIVEGPRGLNEAFDMTPEAQKIVDDLVGYLAGLPTSYFEAKIQRPVGFEEFNTAVIPKGMDPRAVEVLKNAGLKIRRYDSKGKSRKEVIAEQKKLLFQEGSDDSPNRAQIEFTDDAIIIRMLEASDLSSFLHESGHLFLELEKRRAVNGTTKDQQAILDWLGVESFDDIQTEHHEKWARGFEAYLMEGKAPSSELREAFRQFSRWLKSIYKSIRSLDVELSDEVRGVMDRMLATDEQIAQVNAQQAYKPFFTDAAIAGMTEAEYQDYLQRNAKAAAKASETLQQKILAQLTRQTEKWWKAELRDEVALAREALLEENVYQASEFLAGRLTIDGLEPVKLSREAVDSTLGGDTAKNLPRKLFKMTAKKGGQNPDEVASLFGFESGHEMLNAIIESPTLKEQADTNAEQAMKSKHGDILNDGTLEDQARQAAHNEERGRLILQELRALTRKQGKTPSIDRSALKAEARDVIGKTKVKDLRPAIYHRAEVKAAQRAQAALDAGDTVAAIQAKTQQAANFYLWREAVKAREDADKVRRFANKFKKKTVRERLGKSGNGYLNQIDAILQRFDFRKVPPKDDTNIIDWETERRAEGDNIQLSKLVRSGTAIPFKELPIDELMGVYDSLRNIDFQSLRAHEFIINKEKAEFKEVRDQLVAHIEKLKTIEENTAARVAESDKHIYVVRSALSKLTDMGSLTLWLDNNERAGLAHKLMMDGINEAYDQEFKMWADVATPIIDAIKNRSKEDIARHNAKISVPVLGTVSFHQLIAVALNTGTESNLDKLTRGEGILTPDGNVDTGTLNAILAPLNKSDWDLVQLIWNQTNQLYKPLADVAERQTGIRPPKVEARKVETRFGTFEGGYYPIKYDPYRDDRAAANDAKKAEEAGLLFESFFARPGVDAGARYERTDFAAPLRLSLDVIQNHLQETIHYITHYEAVKQVYKLIDDAEVKAAIKSKVGTEEYQQIKPWLQAVAKDGKEAEPKAFGEKFFQRMRLGVTLGTMGFKASTGLMQLAGMTNTIAELNRSSGRGTKHVAAAVRFLYGDLSLTSFREKFDAAAQQSKVLDHRVKTMDREIKNAMNRIQDKTGFLADMQEVSMKHIALIQTYMVDAVSWYAAYNAKLEEFSQDVGTGTYDAFKESANQRAARYADWVVENVQGSGATKDLSAVMRSQNEFYKQFTMFMTFFAKLQNRERTMVRELRAGQASALDVAVWSFLALMLPVLYEMVIRGEIDGEDDVEELLTNVSLTSINGVPFLRDFANATLTEYGYNMSPIGGMIARGIQSSKGIADPDKKITKGKVKAASKMLGAYFGIPGVNQTWATGESAYLMLKKGEDQSLSELVVTGPKK